MPNQKQETTATTPYRLSLHERILSTAMTQFTRQGVRSVKMDDLAGALGISKRTLYELYSNKEDLLFEGVKRFYERKRQEDKRIKEGSGNVMDTLLRLYQHAVMQQKQVNPVFYTDLEHYPNIVAYLHEEAKKTHEERKQFIQRGVEEGYFRSDVNIELVLQVFEIIAGHLVHDRLITRYSLSEIYNSVIFLSLRGLCTEQGLKRLDQFLENNKKSSEFIVHSEE